jgi:outer membrane receptor for ferrienterochelin and colicin
VILGTGRGGSTNAQGEYVISDLPAGQYVVEFSYIGYRTEWVENFSIKAELNAHLDMELQLQSMQLSEIIVTPGQFSVKGKEPTVRQTLTKENLQTIPFGEDIYRAITRLPGVSANDFSAKFTVRGGRNEEILVLMDGQELFEPFHLKDLDGGALSIVDVDAIEGIDLYTGGFPAEYGESLSGVFNMKSDGNKRGQSQTSLGISFMNARIMSQGNFQQDKGSWLFSSRRGYLDLVLKLMEEENPPQPIYYDIFGKLKYKISKKNTIAINILHSGDKLDFIEDDEDEASTTYGNSYGWLTVNSMMNPRLFIRTIGSFGRISHNRWGIGYFDDLGDINYTVSDENWVNLFGLKQDWDFELLERWFLKWGVYYNYQAADYDYFNTVAYRDWINQNNYRLVVDSTSANLNPQGARFGGYFSNRFQVVPSLTVEVGLRYDRNAYTDDQHLSPRFNIVYKLGKQTFLRGGWGYFYQSQRMHEIKVAYGETAFFPRQLSKHWVAGLEHTFGNGLNLRFESYYKKISDIRPDHRTFSNTIEIFPEVQEDIFSLSFNGAESKGVEFYVKYDKGGKFSYWASYALAYAEEDVQNLFYQWETYILEGPVIPNRYDQRHTIYVDLNYRPNRKWHLNVSWQYHTGWPYTRQLMHTQQLPDGSTQYYVIYDNLYGTKFPPYHRMDLQINRHFYFTRNRLSLFLAVINLYDRGNIRNIKYNWRTGPNGIPYLDETKEYWFHLLPSLGVSWTWKH